MSAAELRFCKMHGAGNDFLIIDALARPFVPETQLLRRLADRRRGVGCDQILIMDAPQRPDADLHCLMFNADGSETAQCGNGLRCLGHLAVSRGITPGPEVRIQTAAGIMEVTHLGAARAQVCMPVPDFRPAHIPLEGEAQAPRYALSIDGRTLEFGAVSLGNPHAVVEVEDITQAPVQAWGDAFNADPRFPQGVNAGFMQILAPDAIRLRVFERGAEETPACGSGACAAVAVGRLWERLDAEVEVRMAGGTLTVHWDGGAEQHILLQGEVAYTFDGYIAAAALTA